MTLIRRSASILLSFLLIFSLLSLDASALIKNGSRGSEVVHLQQNLSVLGFSPGGVDGIAGVNTVSAVRRYQSARGLSVDGIAGPDTLGRIYSEVTEIQSLLKNKGYYTDSVDGIAGKNTLAAIKNFQGNNGLTADGIVGERTLSALRGGSTTRYRSISLSVPYYRQKDSRWANVKLPGSPYGSIIKNSGCVITSVAMGESYRRGYAVTPLNIVKEYSFTKGDLIWNNYSGVITSATQQQYLQKIYDLLAEGKPALVWVQGSNGRARGHMVVVTGVKGGDSLSMSSFLIHDPGYDNRTTLGSYPSVDGLRWYK